MNDQTIFTYDDCDIKDYAEADDRYYYSAFFADLIAFYVTVYVTDNKITDQTMHIEWYSGKFEGETIKDLIGNEFELPDEIVNDLTERLKYEYHS